METKEQSSQKLSETTKLDKRKKGMARNTTQDDDDVTADSLVQVFSPSPKMNLHDVVVQQVTEAIDKGGISP